MAEVATIQSKQPDEVKPVTVDFSDALAEGESIDTATVTAYEWDDRDRVSEELDLVEDYPGADEATLTVYKDGVALGSITVSLAAALTRLWLQADNETAWVETTEDIAPEEYVGWDSTKVTFNVANGVAGMTYKITVVVVTDGGHTFEQDVLMEVEQL